jgi:hypothetical protein
MAQSAFRGMSQLGQTEKSRRATGKSALPSITDFVRGHRHVSKVPVGDMLRSDAISRALSSLHLDKLPGGATRTPCIANVSMM